ncbi:hypothetical protein P8452_66588 [Trifolium repens]|nr:hypothetical protein P8452_66588 [Trifolium repens]
MIDFRKLRLTFTFFNFTLNHTNLKPSLNPRFYSTKNSLQLDVKPKLGSKSTIKEAQSALLEYLHSTRSLQFLDADNMCKNSPFFLQNLVEKSLKNENTINAKRSISRYLRYHPINEFEPFFESLGLKPSEYTHLLPRGLIFLNDDPLLMENYHTLCNYGVPRSKMGKIFKLAPQVLSFENGVLSLKLKAYENLGVSPSILMNAVAFPVRNSWLRLFVAVLALFLRNQELLTEIEMEPAEIGKIFQSHTLFIGSSTLKTTKSLLGCLNVGKKRLCSIVQDNPLVMKNWVLGKRVKPLVSLREAEEEKSKAGKMEFLLRLGYVENTKQMNRAFKMYRGKGAELQERFDFIVKAGLTRDQVRRMIRVSPQILNQNTDTVKMKIEYLVKQGYSISDLGQWPRFGL